MQKQTCEYLERCPMFEYFHTSARQLYVDVYCQGSYEICHRRRKCMAGETVPDNMLPHGGTLWDDDSQPPTS